MSGRNNLMTWAILALLVVGAIVVLNFLISIAAGLFWPLVLIGAGIAGGLWWADRGRRR